MRRTSEPVLRRQILLWTGSQDMQLICHKDCERRTPNLPKCSIHNLLQVILSPHGFDMFSSMACVDDDKVDTVLQSAFSSPSLSSSLLNFSLLFSSLLSYLSYSLVLFSFTSPPLPPAIQTWSGSAGSLTTKHPNYLAPRFNSDSIFGVLHYAGKEG